MLLLARHTLRIICEIDFILLCVNNELTTVSTREKRPHDGRRMMHLLNTNNTFLIFKFKILAENHK